MLRPVPAGSAYILAGPTASGKTEVAHRLALEAGCEILSADSMLVYRGMDIGTAKPEPTLRAEVRYWGLDLVNPGEPFSVSAYQEEARQAMQANAARGRGMIIVGGTGLYIKALVEGLDESPPANPELRARLERQAAEEGVGALRRTLEETYPDLAATLNESDRGNSRRLVRAMELGAAGFVSVRRNWTDPSGRAVVTALRVPPERLKARIEQRVRRMYAGGFLDEVKALFGNGFDQAPTACQAIGYAEGLACLSGNFTVDAAQAETARRTWQLARRQMTWFRNQANIRWVDLEADLPPEAVARRVAQAWRETGPAKIK